MTTHARHLLVILAAVVSLGGFAATAQANPWPSNDDFLGMLGIDPSTGEYVGLVDIWDLPGEIHPSPASGELCYSDDGSEEVGEGDWTCIVLKPKGRAITLTVHVHQSWERIGRITMFHTRARWTAETIPEPTPYESPYNEPPGNVGPNTDGPVPEGSSGQCLEYSPTPDPNDDPSATVCSYWS